MRFKHMGWLRLSLAEAETEKTPGKRGLENMVLKFHLGQPAPIIKIYTVVVKHNISNEVC